MENKFTSTDTTEIVHTLAPKLYFQRRAPSWFIIFSSITLALMGLFGIIGNTLVIVVYKKNINKSASILFVIALAVVDCVACIIYFPSLPVNYAYADVLPLGLIDIWSILLLLLTLSSVSILCLIAIDRYRSVCRPFAQQIGYKRGKKLLIISMVWTFLLSVLYEITRPNINLIDFYVFVLIVGMFLCLNFLLIVCLYICIFWTLYRRRRVQVTPEGAQDKESIPKAPRKVLVTPVQKFDENIELQFHSPVPKDVNPFFTVLQSHLKEEADEPGQTLKILNHNSKLKEQNVTSGLCGASVNPSTSSVKGTDGRECNQAKRVQIKKRHDIYAAQTAKILLVITLAFVSSYIIPFLLVAFKAIGDIPEHWVFVYNINHIINPVIYCFMNKRFRQESKKTLMSVKMFCFGY